jgi:4-hydroxybenzoate polyprenyltransferase
VKNLFLLIPPFFAGILFHVEIFPKLIIGFLAFSFAASAVYIFNDIKDLKNDLLHPAKKHRPIASGSISISTAYIMIIILLPISIFLSFYTSFEFFLIIIIYLSLNFCYSLGLKNIAILDIMIISSGFVLRTLSGGIIANVVVSKWLILMIFLLALFLAMAKRLDDLIVEQETGLISRKNIGKYNIPYISSGITMLAGIIIVCYIMYSISDGVTGRQHSDHVYLTSVFVIAGILRYLQIILVENKGWSPTRILYKDSFIIITVILWAFSYIFIIYF